MKELSELEKTLLMGLYNQRIDDDGKYFSVKEICPNLLLGMSVLAARQLSENHLIKCSDASCSFANITSEGVEYVESHLIQDEINSN